MSSHLLCEERGGGCHSHFHPRMCLPREKRVSSSIIISGRQSIRCHYCRRAPFIVVFSFLFSKDQQHCNLSFQSWHTSITPFDIIILVIISSSSSPKEAVTKLSVRL